MIKVKYSRHFFSESTKDWPFYHLILLIL